VININALWDYDQPAESERRFRDALTAAGDAQTRAELLTQVARAQGLQRQFDAANATLAQAEALIAPGMARAQVRARLERGRVLNSSGQRDASRPLFAQAYELALASGLDFLTVDAAHMRGIVEPPESALAWNLTAIELAERSSDPEARRWLGTLYNNIGWAYHDMGRAADALDMFQRGLAWRERNRRGPQDDGGIRIAKWSVARALRSAGRIDEALRMQRALLEELDHAGERDGYVFEEIGECLLALGRADQAAPYFARAHAELAQDAWLAANEAARLERLKGLGAGG
jgi:tetratricopeptide (TPR) repeat protein